jgi:hypothetical protein
MMDITFNTTPWCLLLCYTRRACILLNKFIYQEISQKLRNFVMIGKLQDFSNIVYFPLATSTAQAVASFIHFLMRNISDCWGFTSFKMKN